MTFFKEFWSVDSKGDSLLTVFLKLSGVPFTRTYSNKLFEEHPHKDNLYGLSSMLRNYKIENTGIRFEDKSNIHSLATPFIAHFANEFIIVKEVSPTSITYYWHGKPITLTTEEFLKTWKGVALVTDIGTQSAEPDYRKNKIQERYKGFSLNLLKILALLSLILIFFHTNKETEPVFITSMLLNMAGIYICYLLLLKQVHIYSSQADKICSIFKKSDCNNVLESDAAKFMGIIGWSETGFGYFTSNLLFLLIFPEDLAIYSLLNLLTLPYTLWSVWYQKFKVKQWCPLCLTVTLLLWCIFSLNCFSGFINFPSITPFEAASIIVIYLLPFLLISLLLPVFSYERKLKAVIYEMNSFKLKDDVFNALLKSGKRFSIDESVSHIIFGNPEAKTCISILTNPHCQPCARMHKRIEAILDHNENKISIQYIFTSFNKSLDDSNKFLIAAYQNNSRQQTLTIYREWFEGAKHKKDEYMKRFNYDLATDAVKDEFNAHEKWKNQTGLRATPTILVDGYELPNSYRLEDIINLEIKS